jgi:hypothetical protein
LLPAVLDESVFDSLLLSPLSLFEEPAAPPPDFFA